MNLFSSNAGRIVELPDNGVPMALSVDGWGNFHFRQAILTQLGLNEVCNVQFLHTLRNFIYIYTFGDRIADLVLGGYMATATPCHKPASPNTNSSGFERVLNFYRENRVSETGLPITVAIGRTIVLRAFLIAAKLDFVDPKDGLGQFMLVLKYSPYGRVTIPEYSLNLDFFIDSEDIIFDTFINNTISPDITMDTGITWVT